MKIYIAGPMTGIENFNRDEFYRAELDLVKLGHIVWNPAYHPDGFTHAEYMQVCLPAVRFCDAVYMLNGWEQSVGATAEYVEAVSHNKTIFFQSHPDKRVTDHDQHQQRGL